MQIHVRFVPFAVAALVFAGAALAQSEPAQTVHFTDQSGAHVTLHVGQQAGPDNQTPPAFSDLAHGKGYITQEDARAYPLLADDFNYADRHHKGRLSKADYAWWLKQQ